MALETHGTWPWGAAVLAPVSTLALARRGRAPALWLAMPALFWHQTEEWVYPGGFLPWFNREMLGGQEDEFPITRELGLRINVGGGWGIGTLAAAIGPRAPFLAGVVGGLHIGNAVVHGSALVRDRRWNPGLVTGVGLLAPVGVRIVRESGGRAAVAGALAGLGLSAGLFLRLRGRATR